MAGNDGFTAEERAAMRARAKELKAQQDAASSLAELLAKIAELEGDERVFAERIHAIVTEHAPALTPKTWYGMPSYADAAGKSVVFFKPGSKFKVRYSNLGFNEAAKLDEGTFWPTEYALTALTPEVEARIVGLVKRAAG
ncbi:hypothetical protein QT381_01745 [Galbitalea sp. SE-J8]|uniref:hypothetical protein n=1 Tax=Galbitalea sp. SE-J8 TaxID=3054952 RepID=UPI00259CC749|nr:hypothetical protein [Galbitalea sp. SE-J8]MDM4761726.1 hypothetical protein [Galbitalea sp. SE-J8]